MGEATGGGPKHRFGVGAEVVGTHALEVSYPRVELSLGRDEGGEAALLAVGVASRVAHRRLRSPKGVGRLFALCHRTVKQIVQSGCCQDC